MDLNDYLNPVGLEKPGISIIPEKLTFCRSVDIHIPSIPVGNIASYDLAIVGVPEDGNATVKGSALAPDRVRSKLYQLTSINRKTRIIDLGNIKITGNINDTYYALRDITIELRNNNVVPVFIGGSQDLSYGINLAFDKIRKTFTLGTIDARIDYGLRLNQITSAGYLNHLLKGKKSEHFNYFNIGHQVYFTHLKIIDQLEKKGYDCVRLGAAREDLSRIEPFIRDAGFISIDMSCVRQSDAPGVIMPSPNGFFGHELCQMARYAGTASNIEAIGLFNILPENDIDDQTCHLGAQALWYFMEGYSLKINEKGDKAGNKRYIVNLQELGYDLTFYKSERTDRWWMEIPFSNEETGVNRLVSCSYTDYQQACNQDMPNRLWKAYRRFF